MNEPTFEPLVIDVVPSLPLNLPAVLAGVLPGTMPYDFFSAEEWRFFTEWLSPGENGKSFVTIEPPA